MLFVLLLKSPLTIISTITTITVTTITPVVLLLLMKILLLLRFTVLCKLEHQPGKPSASILSQALH